MRVRRGIAGVLVGVAAPLALAGSASAHVPTWSVTCGKVSVSLTNYNKDKVNTVTLIVDGEKLLDKKQFPDKFAADFPVKAHSKDIKAELIVSAGDDPDGKEHWSIDQTKTIAPCESPSPRPSSPKPSTPPPSTPAPSKPATHSPSPSPTPTGPQLASTGGGGETPLIAGAGAAVVVAGGGLLFLGRRRSTRRH